MYVYFLRFNNDLEKLNYICLIDILVWWVLKVKLNYKMNIGEIIWKEMKLKIRNIILYSIFFK